MDYLQKTGAEVKDNGEYDILKLMKDITADHLRQALQLLKGEDDTSEKFNATIENTQTRENFFAQMYCIQNRLHLLIRGPPGSSKTHTARLVKNFLDRDCEPEKYPDFRPITG